MSGNSVNYYDLLQIHPQAEPETIQRVYRMFAARFHPDNAATGDLERFRAIREAYDVLMDPARRSEYDSRLASQKQEPLPVFQRKEFTEGIDAEAKLRVGVLCILYSRRRANPDLAALSLLDLEQIMAFPNEHLQFAIWYLRSKGYISYDDHSSLMITADGVDYLESQLPQNPVLYDVFRATETGVMILPRRAASSNGT